MVYVYVKCADNCQLPATSASHSSLRHTFHLNTSTMSRFALQVALLLSAIFLSFSSMTAQVSCIRGNCDNGNGLADFPDGARYEGDFQAGKMHGRGILTYADGSKYIGNWQQNQRIGRGRLVLIDGSEYLGEFANNVFHGQGAMKYANGNHYEGSWMNGQPSGWGIFTFANGDSYQGNLRDGQLDGRGVMRYHNGSQYDGEWKANLRHGSGSMTYPGYQPISGRWTEDQYLFDWGRMSFVEDTSSFADCNTIPCDRIKGRMVLGNGIRFMGEFMAGLPQGMGIAQLPGGDRYEGEWKLFAPDGRGVMYGADGSIRGGIWQNGQLIWSLFSAAPPAQPQVAVKSDSAIRIWAVVVGAARYTHMPSLRYADDDAYQIFAFLKSPEGGALPDNQLRLLIDEDATRENVLAAMRTTFLQADDNDVVILYFSGHGLPGAFLPVDYDGYHFRLEHDEISGLLRQSRARHKVVMADACHSGSLLAARTASNIEISRYYNALEESKGGTALLLSSKSEEYSLEDKGLRSGIFSHFLIRGLKGEADSDNNQIVTITELFTFVYKQVRLYTGNIQTPTITGSYDAQMPVSFVR